MMPAGRPTKYSEELCDQAYKLYLLKATDEEVADFFGVHVDTLHEWRKVHEEFLKTTKRGKLQADAEVAEKLRHRAIGYSHEAVKIFMPADASEPVYAKYIEHYPPDTQAISLWLRNRQPEKWRDKTDHAVTGADGKDLIPETTDLKEIARLMAFLLTAGAKEAEQSNPATGR